MSEAGEIVSYGTAAAPGRIRQIPTRPHPSRDVLDVLRRLLEHRTNDVGSYEFVLEAWIEEAADEIERLRKKQVQ